MQPMGAKQRGWPTSTSPRSPPIAPQPTDELPADIAPGPAPDNVPDAADKKTAATGRGSPCGTFVTRVATLTYVTSITHRTAQPTALLYG